jgi:hypothetical protein
MQETGQNKTGSYFLAAGFKNFITEEKAQPKLWISALFQPKTIAYNELL